MSQNKYPEIKFSAILQLSREIFLKNIGKILLSNLIWPFLLILFLIGAESTPYTLYHHEKTRVIFSLLLSIPILGAYPFIHIILSLCYIEDDFIHLKKALSFRYYSSYFYPIAGRFFCCVLIQFFLIIALCPFIQLCLGVPYLMYLLSFPLMRSLFLSLDNQKRQHSQSLLEIISLDSKEPVSIHHNIPAIKAFNVIHSLIAAIGILCITWILFKTPLFFELHMLELSIFSLFFLIYMNYILLVNVVLYRVRGSSYCNHTKSEKDIEDNGAKE